MTIPGSVTSVLKRKKSVKISNMHPMTISSPLDENSPFKVNIENIIVYIKHKNKQEQ